MTTTIRLNEKTEARLKRVAKRRGLSKSDYVRSAIEAQLDRDEPAKSSWELIENLCGKFELGDPELSRREPGEVIRAKYHARHGRRAR